MYGRTIAQVALVLAGLSNLALGAWAMFAPRSFFDTLASDFEPYNHHLIHDIGAFTAGLGVTALVALVWRDGWSVALAGNGAAAIAHLGSHLADRDIGSSPTDPFGLALFAAFLVTALVAFRLRGEPAETTAGQATPER
jgi:hypothetical protein